MRGQISQKPDIRRRKSIADAIVHHHSKRLWEFLTSYCLPSLLCDKQEEVAKMLSLQSPSPRTESADEFGQSQLLYAVDLQNNDAVEDLLIARADVTCMGDIAKALQHTRLT